MFKEFFLLDIQGLITRYFVLLLKSVPTCILIWNIEWNHPKSHEICMVEIVRGQFNIHLLIYVCHRSSSGSREIKTQTGNYSGTIKQYIGQNIIPNMVKLSIHFAINIFLVSGIVSEYMSHGHVHCNDINCSIPHKNAFGFAAQIFASLVFN